MYAFVPLVLRNPDLTAGYFLLEQAAFKILDVHGMFSQSPRSLACTSMPQVKSMVTWWSSFAGSMPNGMGSTNECKPCTWWGVESTRFHGLYTSFGFKRGTGGCMFRAGLKDCRLNMMACSSAIQVHDRSPSNLRRTVQQCFTKGMPPGPLAKIRRL